MTINLWTVLTICLLGCCYGHSVCGPESCNDLSIVKACHNVHECIEQIWLKQTPTGYRDNVCDICLKMVKEARDQLESNETMDEIRQAFEENCKLLIAPPVVKECKHLVDEFVPELVAMLSSQMDPETVCTVAKLCNNDKLRMEQENSRECTVCRNFIASATDFIKKVPKVDFKEEVLHVCRSMGTYSDACALYAPLLGNYYFNQTTYALAKQPCEVVGICPKPSKSLVRPSSATSWRDAKTQLCSLCPVVAGDVQKQLLRTGSVENFAAKVSAVCEALALSNDKCSEIADYPRLFSYLSKDFDPVRFCSQSFGLCSRRDEEVPVWPLLPTGVVLEKAFDSIKKERVKISWGDPIEGSLISFPDDENNCQFCLKMFDSFSEMAGVDKYYLSDIFGVVCPYVAEPKKCEDLFTVSNREFFDIFIDNFSSEKVCPEIVSSCIISPGEISLIEDEALNGSCVFCLKIFQSLSQGLIRKEARSKLRVYLLGMCELLPQNFRTTCQNFVHVFIEKTLLEVLTKYSGNETCTYLKLCGNEPEVTMSKSEKLAWLSESERIEVLKKSCKTCLLVIETLFQELGNRRNEDEIRKALEKLCNNFPGLVKNYCDTIVNQHTEEIIHLVTSGVTPSEVCEKLRFCPPNGVTVTSTPVPSALPRVALSGGSQPLVVSTKHSKIPCNFCLTALRMLLQQLQSDKTEEAIRKAIEGLCNYFPEETQDTCRSLIDQYSDDVIDMIIADFNATEICVYLKICEPNSEQEKEGSTFSVATNEVHDSYGFSGACGFCTLLQNSMAVKGNKEKAAESLLAFLVDVCMIGFPHIFQDCKHIVSQRILPYGKDGILRMSNVCVESGLCPATTVSPEKILLRRMHEAVQECALCETLVEIIASHEKMMVENFDFWTSASLICSTVPEDMKAKCESVLVSYGPSIVNLLTSKTEPQKVCSELSLCDQSQQAKLHMPVSQVEAEPGECMQGPGFWCANLENSKKCGTLPHCQEIVWKQKVPRQ